MDQNKEQTASPASDRILDRKIESRALPSSFSANLGRKAPAGDKAGAGKSVRAIVDWLEKTSTSGSEPPGLRTPEGREKAGIRSASSHSPNTAKPDSLQATAPEPAVASPFIHPERTTPTHPEDYSLTLLAYKSYFNNRPLARCLDDVHKGASSAPGSTPQPPSASSCYSTQKLDSAMATLQEIRDAAEQGSPTPLGRPSMKEASQSAKRNGVYAAHNRTTCAASGVSEPEPAAEAQAAHRDPAQVKAF